MPRKLLILSTPKQTIKQQQHSKTIQVTLHVICRKLFCEAPRCEL